MRPDLRAARLRFRSRRNAVPGAAATPPASNTMLAMVSNFILRIQRANIKKGGEARFEQTEMRKIYRRWAEDLMLLGVSSQ